VLHLWKDKILKLTIGNGHYHWMLVQNKTVKIGRITSFVELLEFFKNLNVHRLKIEITLMSEVCRYAVIPALQTWPESEVLDFLKKQQLKQQYPDVDSGDYVLLNDKINFNRPILVTAVHQRVWHEIEEINRLAEIKFVLTDIMKIWNSYNKSIGNGNILIVKSKIAILVRSLEQMIFEINTFPRSMINHIEYDYKFDFLSVEYTKDESSNELALNDCLLVNKEFESYILEDSNQILNLLESK
jgi:hypothetical protein